MKFSLPQQGVPRPPSSSYGIIAEKRRNSTHIINNIAENLIKEGVITTLWDEKTGHKAVLAICKQKEFEHGDPTFVSGPSIMIVLRNLLKNQATNRKV
jgi:pyruvoyl-dependent arginine decarboxylase (PvlArgDC)